MLFSELHCNTFVKNGIIARFSVQAGTGARSRQGFEEEGAENVDTSSTCDSIVCQPVLQL